MTTPPPEKWLSLIGIGEDGIEALFPAARKMLAQAHLVVGGARHLALAGPLAAETMTWPSPLADAIPKILARRGSPVCVLASGDPFAHFGGRDVEGSIQELPDAGLESGDRVRFRQSANRGPERADAWGDLVPVAELEQDERCDCHYRQRGQSKQGPRRRAPCTLTP